MENIIELRNSFEAILLSLGYVAPITCSLFILLESFLPFLPLVLFISINMIVLGNFVGIMVSYVFVVAASYLSFIFFKKYAHKYFLKYDKIREHINNIHFSRLIILMSFPFAPSSLINFFSAIGDVNKNVYFQMLVISKIFVVLFWGFVGKTFYESLFDIKIIVGLLISMIVVYFIGKYIEKKVGIENGKIC